MLAYFVNGYVNANVIAPDYILVLFIVSVLALAWAVFTLFLYHRSSANARFVALIDLGMCALRPASSHCATLSFVTTLHLNKPWLCTLLIQTMIPQPSWEPS